MKKVNTTIALLNSCPELEVVTDSDDYRTRPDIELVIARFDEKSGHPLNARFEWDGPRFQPGGCTARIYSTYYGVNTILSGPSLSHCDDCREYESAAVALQTIHKLTEKMRASRGSPVDVADETGRWLEACGVDLVYFREGFDQRHEWHSRGEWRSESVGDCVQRIRKATLVATEAYKAREAEKEARYAAEHAAEAQAA